MAFDDDKPHDWDPEKEKKQTDPEELARTFVRAAAEEQRKIDEEARARRVDDDVDRPALLTCRPPALDLQLSIHLIKNGIVVTYGQSPHGHPLTFDLATTEYGKDAEAALAIVHRVAQEFFQGPAAGVGLPPAPVDPRTLFPPIGPG